ncbi:MAG: YfhO family protein, partial [Patescibacteria group bacterium]
FNRFYKWACLLIILLTAGELLRQSWKYLPFVKPELVFPQTEITQYLEENIGNNRLLITNGELFPPNANLAYQIPMIDGYASIRDKRYDYLVRLMAGNPDPNDLKTYDRIIYQPDWRSQVADLLRVKYVLSLYEIDDSRLSLVLHRGETWLYEKSSAFDLAFFVDSYSVGNDLSGIAQQMLTTDLSRQAILEKEIGRLDLGRGKVEVVSYQDNEIILNTSNDKVGLLLLTEAYDPGWRATIDGQSVGILRADLDIRAIVVDRGDHQVKLDYRPVGWKLPID